MTEIGLCVITRPPYLEKEHQASAEEEEHLVLLCVCAVVAAGAVQWGVREVKARAKRRDDLVSRRVVADTNGTSQRQMVHADCACAAGAPAPAAARRCVMLIARWTVSSQLSWCQFASCYDGLCGRGCGSTCRSLQLLVEV
jgi:hypothetical protein